MEAESYKRTRKNWLNSLKSEIMELRNSGESDNAIKKSMHRKFRNYSTTIERFVGWVCAFIVLALVGFGLHISYAILMWEAHIYEFSVYFSPYLSMLIFAILCVVLLGVFTFYLGYFADFFKFYKMLEDTLEERFYLKVLKMFLILGLTGFAVFLIMIFFIGLQISEFYGMPLGRSLFEVLREVLD